jgi:hypothetical protein
VNLFMGEDGASLLARELLDADDVDLLGGQGREPRASKPRSAYKHYFEGTGDAGYSEDS